MNFKYVSVWSPYTVNNALYEYSYARRCLRRIAGTTAAQVNGYAEAVVYVSLSSLYYYTDMGVHLIRMLSIITIIITIIISTRVRFARSTRRDQFPPYVITARAVGGASSAGGKNVVTRRTLYS